MNYAIIKKLPTSDELIDSIPLSDQGYHQIAVDRKDVKNIIEGHDSRLLIVAGPCSAWPKKAVLSYAEKMCVLNEKIKDKIKLVMRVYIQKPRTTKGWTGPVNQPDPFSHPDIEAGARYVRDMMVKVIEMGLPIADEALFTHNAGGFLELLSWVAIGARSAEDQEHRIFASAIDCAVGLKNPTHGELGIGVNSVLAAQSPHVAAFDGYEVQTRGNLHAHLVLRGCNGKPNYQTQYIEEAKKHMEAKGIQNPAIIIDASHDNCVINGKKDYHFQTNVVHDVIESLAGNPELKKLVKGFMLESFLQAGAQQLDINNPDALDLNGLSITDPCLNWDQTEKLLLEVAQKI
ncbi:MAG: aroF [Gammaproteobacteria bacterium]|jgi:3-deoxy-7-phosphoheptulonate synthase|nr:aroF [Gammaproteobacteria bacterium]